MIKRDGSRILTGLEPDPLAPKPDEEEGSDDEIG